MSQTRWLASLRARMTWGFTLAFAGFLVVACGASALGFRQFARTQARDATRDAATLVANEWEETHLWPTALTELREQPRLSGVFVRIVDERGGTVAVSGRTAPAWPHQASDGWLINVKTVATYRIIAGIDWRSREADARSQALLLIVACLLVTGAAATLAWALVGRTLRPIGALADQADSATDDPLLVQLAAPSDDAEVQRLVLTLNQMLARLRKHAMGREQFYAAAAHELRTPLSVLSSSIEAALSRPRSGDEYVGTLIDLQAETRRLITLTEDLLTLNRLQAHLDNEYGETVDIAERCELNLALLAPLIQARQLRVEVSLPPDAAETLAPLAHVDMLTRNLLENAVKYGSWGGRVRMSVQVAAGGVQLTIYNDFAHPETLPFDRLFEPFFRIDPARSLESGGNGLGLAICRRLADTHGWRLHLAAEEQGVRANVDFPASPG